MCLLALPCWAQHGSAELPFDVFNEAIDSGQIYDHLEKNAILQKQLQAPEAANILYQQLQDSKTYSEISFNSLASQQLSDSNDLYSHMVKSCLYLGQFYDCGHCDRSHMSTSCGVVIDESGLALTNHHVLSLRQQGTTEGFMAMTYDGQCFEVEEVLAADKVADIALVKLKAKGHKFHAAPIAKTRPLPTTEVRLVSHPSSEFFVMTKGEVSRYSRTSFGKSNQRTQQTWMEITAAFGGGSSGCGVFNSSGEVVGIASRIRPLSRSNTKTTSNGKVVTLPRYPEMILRRCVNLSAIKACFQPHQRTPASADESRK